MDMKLPLLDLPIEPYQWPLTVSPRGLQRVAKQISFELEGIDRTDQASAEDISEVTNYFRSLEK